MSRIDRGAGEPAGVGRPVDVDEVVERAGASAELPAGAEEGGAPNAKRTRRGRSLTGGDVVRADDLHRLYEARLRGGSSDAVAADADEDAAMPAEKPLAGAVSAAAVEKPTAADKKLVEPLSKLSPEKLRERLAATSLPDLATLAKAASRVGGGAGGKLAQEVGKALERALQGVVGMTRINYLAQMSAAELRESLLTATPTQRAVVLREIDEYLDAPGAHADDVQKLQGLKSRIVGTLDDVGREWAVEYYGKMDDDELVRKLGRTRPDHIVSLLRGVASYEGVKESAPEAHALRKRLISALRIGMELKEGTPSATYDAIDPMGLLEAATRLPKDAPGAPAAKAAVAELMLVKYAAVRYTLDFPVGASGARVRVPVPAGTPGAERQEKAKQIPPNVLHHLTRLTETDPARIVEQFVNAAQSGGDPQLLAKLMTQIVKAEYAKDKEKAGQVVGEILGAVAARMAGDVKGTKLVTQDLEAHAVHVAAALDAALAAIDAVADGEQAKIRFGADILRFATGKIASLIPRSTATKDVKDAVRGAADAAVDWLQGRESRKVDAWEERMAAGFGQVMRSAFEWVWQDASHKDYNTAKTVFLSRLPKSFSPKE